MKRIFNLFFITIAFFTSAKAQSKNKVYIKASELTLIGKLLPGKNTYHRLDTADYPSIPSNVKRLLTHSAGMAITFTTNSNTISAKWCVSPTKGGANMTAIAAKGLDLYIKKAGKWQFAGVGSPKDECNEGVIIKDLESGEKECLLYFPLYDKIVDPQVGIDEGSTIKAIPNPFKKKVLIYGSSILQGSSASRAGMAYPARLERETGVEFLNFGLSGSAKMEKAVADIVASINADVYVLDCVPNSSPQEITERTAYLVNKIRSLHPKAPIVMIQSAIREISYFDQTWTKRMKEQNDNFKIEFEKLQKNGVKDLYFIPGADLLGQDHEGTVDGTHPNDLGFDRMLMVIRPVLNKLIMAH